MSTLIGFGALILALGFGGGLLYFFYVPRTSADLRVLMGQSPATSSLSSTILGKSSSNAQRTEEPTTENIAALKKAVGKSVKKKREKVTLEQKFFQAGIFTKEDRAEFARLRLLLPSILGPVLGAAGWISLGPTFGLIGLGFGGLIGLQLPVSILDRRIKRRHEDIMFYLPLVIEQVVIGVSSSLDIGPCLARVIQMADERESHNAVTELLRHAHQYAKSGVAFEEAMNEVGTLSGHTELKHAFKSLAQVAKHGGEITKQLQELADSVASQRETKIETKIKKLELEATGPVGMVFFGFIIILLIGFGTNIMKAFN